MESRIGSRQDNHRYLQACKGQQRQHIRAINEADHHIRSGFYNRLPESSHTTEVSRDSGYGARRLFHQVLPNSVDRWAQLEEVFLDRSKQYQHYVFANARPIVARVDIVLSTPLEPREEMTSAVLT